MPRPLWVRFFRWLVMPLLVRNAKAERGEKRWLRAHRKFYLAEQDRMWVLWEDADAKRRRPVADTSVLMGGPH